MSYCLSDKVDIKVSKWQLQQFRFGLYALMRETEALIKKEKNEEVIETYKDMIKSNLEEINNINKWLNKE